MVPTGLNTLKNTNNKELNEIKMENKEKKSKGVYAVSKISKSFQPKNKNLKRVTTAITTKV